DSSAVSSVGQLRHPVAPPFGRQVEEAPDRPEKIDVAGMTLDGCVENLRRGEVADAVVGPREDVAGGHLSAFGVLCQVVGVVRVAGGREQAESRPPALGRPCVNALDRGLRHLGAVHVMTDVEIVASTGVEYSRTPRVM